MSIIEIYVKNRPRQLFGYIIIPVTSVVHSVPISFVVSLPNATADAHCAVAAAVSQIFAYRTETSVTNVFLPSRRWTQKVFSHHMLIPLDCRVINNIVKITAEKYTFPFYLRGGGIMFLKMFSPMELSS